MEIGDGFYRWVIRQDLGLYFFHIQVLFDGNREKGRTAGEGRGGRDRWTRRHDTRKRDLVNSIGNQDKERFDFSVSFYPCTGSIRKMCSKICFISCFYFSPSLCFFPSTTLFRPYLRFHWNGCVCWGAIINLLGQQIHQQSFPIETAQASSSVTF